MRLFAWKSQTLAGAALMALLTGCGGSSGGGTSAPTPVTVPTGGGQTGQSVSDAEAARLAKQATFGATQATITDIKTAGINAWLDSQFSKTGSSYTEFAARAVPRDYCDALTGTPRSNCFRDYFGPTPVSMKFYANALGSEDQLRQRVAWALSQIVVVSEVDVDSTAGLAVYQQMLLDNAFGNFRDILKAATLNPYMGDFLDMVDSRKTGPNQNYARELMQLFAIYVDQLNPDGTKKLDANGNTIPTYTETDVSEIARALTGWTYARLNGAAITVNNQADYTKPMIVNVGNFDATAKTFLGKTIAANLTPEQNVDAVIDAVFNNSNVGPYIGTLLIQHLVTSNPSPAYVARITAVFNNNGAGVRGDLKAVVRAILTDAEARGDRKTAAADGVLKEPVVLMTALMRAIGTKTDGYVFVVRDNALGQQPFEAPSVFNYYPFDYPLAGSTTLENPSGKLLTTATVHGGHNLVYDWTVSGDATRSEFAAFAGITGTTGTVPDWAPWETLAATPDALIARLDLLLLNNTMTDAQKTALRTAINAITNADPAIQARRRAQMAFYVVATSAQFQVDK